MLAAMSGGRAEFDTHEMKNPKAAGQGKGAPRKGEKKERSQ